MIYYVPSSRLLEKQLARDTVKTVLTNNTKTDISSHCTGQYLHMSLLLQDSVDENSNGRHRSTLIIL